MPEKEIIKKDEETEFDIEKPMEDKKDPADELLELY